MNSDLAVTVLATDVFFLSQQILPSLFQFEFKDVKFMEHGAQTLSLFNDGQVPCQFEFIQKPNESTYSKPWLTANPCKGFIAQGERHLQSCFFQEPQIKFP